jgi:hypothetical protein
MKKSIHGSIFLAAVFFAILNSGCIQKSDHYSRGVGIYPGNPEEDFSPRLVTDSRNYRNIALMRPAWHSSSYDYNLTAQLVTDGIITTEMPSTISLSTSSGILTKNEREFLLDNNSVTEIRVEGNNIWVQLDINRENNLPEITGINLNGHLTYDEKKQGGWNFTCLGSNDGISWTELKQLKGSGLPGQGKPDPFAAMFAAMQANSRKGVKRPQNPFANFFGPQGDSTAPKPSFTFNFKPPEKERLINLAFAFQKPETWHYYRVALSSPAAKVWSFGDFDFYRNSTKLRMTPSIDFHSAWMSAGTSDEWVYVDLGSKSTFNRVRLDWINKAIKGSVQVSDDAVNWKNVAELPADDKMTDEITLASQAAGRYVRVMMNTPANGRRYILSELEVFGKGGLVPVAKPGASVTENRLQLSAGKWKIQRASEVTSGGDALSSAGYADSSWVVATVPGTALVSYWNAGALPDPNFGDNQLMISESFFNSDFWYRDEFKVPSNFRKEKLFLNFDGINWKADVFVNAKNAGRIEGAFIRGQFDVTSLIEPGKTNAIAVLIHKNDNPGVITEQTLSSTDKNGGVLGADNPTFHASVGWDWIPTIRGRNIGIWNDVYLTTKGNVTIKDPFVRTDLPLPDTTSADISVELTLINHSSEPVSGTLSGSFGDVSFDQKVSLEANVSKVVKFSQLTNKDLHIINPRLWWPKGYGDQKLNDVSLTFKNENGSVSDAVKFRAGIREMSYTEDNQILNIYVNGRRFIGRGGNWGFPESNLEYRGREYDAAVAYHADMNFTMIRNWVGQTGDDEFFDACDRHGVMIWQDFWLANPVDGPNPENPQMFMDNATDLVKRLRNHPSIAIYVGRNEGNPPDVIDTALRAMIHEIHPGIHYISNSAFGVVSGGGPYRALPVRDYFLLYGFNKLHSERGMPNVMTYESLKQMLPDSALWPQNSQWGLHDYCYDGAQGASSFNQMIENGFGQARDAREFTELAQWINYNGYRGMFEGRSAYRQGLLLWMSHPAWPSMVWQTYDYYLEPTAAYFGCKKASEPIHIQWNPVYDVVEVVNYSAGNRTGLTAKAQILNMDGSVQWEKETDLVCREDSTAKCFRLEFPKSLSAVHFIKLTLKNGDRIISDNFYWRGLEDGNFRALRDLPKVELTRTTIVQKKSGIWYLTTALKNSTRTPALMIRLKVIGKTSGSRLLPVFYSDNYVSLMPGEEKVITMRLKDADTRGEKPDVEISGFNL